MSSSSKLAEMGFVSTKILLVLILAFVVLRFVVEHHQLVLQHLHASTRVLVVEEDEPMSESREALETFLNIRPYYSEEREDPTPPRLRNDEWEQLDNVTFFRRSAAYYFRDRKLIRLFYVTYAYNDPPLGLQLIIRSSPRSRDPLSLVLMKTWTRRHDQWGSYRAASLNYEMNTTRAFHVNLDKYLTRRRRLALQAYIVRDVSVDDDNDNDNDNKRRRSTLYPIDIKIKNFYSNASIVRRGNRTSVTPMATRKRGGSAICSKCYYYRDNSAYKHFEWWLAVNKRIGYEKIMFCNNSIPESSELTSLLAKYADVVEVYHMHSMPDLLVLPHAHQAAGNNHTSNNYLGSFYDLLGRNGKFYKPMTRVFDNIIFNECYLDNVDKYEYVAVLDNDEAILPRVATAKIDKLNKYVEYMSRLDLGTAHDERGIEQRLALGTDRCWSEHKPHERSVAAYMRKYLADMSVYHRMAIYLKDSIVKTIVHKIEAYLRSNSYEVERSLDESVVQVIDLTPASEQHAPTNYTFVIRSETEFKYARNLCKLYRMLVEPFLSRNQEALDSVSTRFRRLFYVAGKTTKHHFGKTIHHTDRTLQLIHHYPVASGKYKIMLYEHGHCSHFRDTYDFNSTIPIAITELFIDFNYFYCFFKPTLDDLSLAYT